MNPPVAVANDFWATIQPFLAIFGLGGLTFAGAVAIAWQAFKKFGESWLSARFQRNMEALKAEQEKEMERLRHKINSVFDRMVRLHTKEFEVLPEVWGKLVAVKRKSMVFTSLYQQHANVDLMSAKELDEFLDKQPFLETQKDNIRTASKKLDAFINIDFRYKYNDLGGAINEYLLYFEQNGIFIQPALKDKFERLQKLLLNLVTEYEHNHTYDPKPQLRDDRKKWEAEGPALYKEIENDVAERLWDSTKTTV